MTVTKDQAQMLTDLADYRCNHCGCTVKRDSDKRWITSMCDATGRTTRLWRVTK